MKILVVTNMYPEARDRGFGSFVKHQVDALGTLGHSVDVLYIHGYQSKLHYLKAILRILKYTWKGSYDIIHAHYGLCGFPSLFRWKTPLIVTLHGSDILSGRIQPAISRFVCRFADEVIVVSREIASVVKGTIVPCGVDLEVFTPHNRSEARRRIGISDDRKIVLFPFDPARKVKRYDLANGAVAKLRKKGHDLELLVVFGKSNDEMPWYYSAANAMILCSSSEGSPTSVKEALACNLPVVSTNVGDVREMMQGIEGAFVCEDNIDDIGERLEQILSAEGKSIFNGRSHIERYSLTKTVQSIVAVYQRALQKNIE